ncbi:SRPBCC family protein [Kutzneria sp. CA-103260]|uniref:SRPBCC family protein n=1 Tax=Kutzneria sp. CA-103260 TaxID=2802641 RepID=UPI001BA46E4C|nr:SRPBCC family protein [Kutzneria sp. CA-103260]QUQ69513.1 carbon monoxide dehydrogenase subunit G [Kutzneria sp. CA-103260]
MRLEHQFRVAAPVDEVWSALLDPRRVAPCMPGATLGEVTDESFTGSVKVKLGPVALLYKGTGSFEATDEASRRAVIKASGKDSRGSGTASATVEVTLSADPGGTVARVVTDLSVTGRPAQFGRGMITEVGGKILDQFAGCLAGKLAPAAEKPPAEPAPPAAATLADPSADDAAGSGSRPGGSASDSQPASSSDSPTTASPPRTAEERAAGTEEGAAAPEAEPLDLMQFAGTSVAKRAVVVIGLVVLLIVVVGWLRRR